MSTYLSNLKESVIILNPKLTRDEIDFSGSTYTGNETIGDLLKESGFILENEILNEAIFDTSISKIKSMASTISNNINDMEGMKKIKSSLGGLASKLSISDIKNYALKLAATKGVDEKATLGAFSMLLRVLATASNSIALITPLGWLILIIALIKAGDLDTFRNNVNDSIKELKRAIEHGSGPFDSALSMGAVSWGLALACLLPPWIQQIVFAPLSILFGIASFVMFIIAFLDQFGKK